MLKAFLIGVHAAAIVLGGDVDPIEEPRATSGRVRLPAQPSSPPEEIAWIVNRPRKTHDFLLAKRDEIVDVEGKTQETHLLDPYERSEKSETDFDAFVKELSVHKTPGKVSELYDNFKIINNDEKENEQ